MVGVGWGGQKRQKKKQMLVMVVLAACSNNNGYIGCGRRWILGLPSEKDGHDGFRGGQGWALAALTSGECEGMAGLG